jgi:hypothetical protein
MKEVYNAYEKAISQNYTLMVGQKIINIIEN